MPGDATTTLTTSYFVFLSSLLTTRHSLLQIDRHRRGQAGPQYPLAVLFAVIDFGFDVVRAAGLDFGIDEHDLAAESLGTAVFELDLDADRAADNLGQRVVRAIQAAFDPPP